MSAWLVGVTMVCSLRFDLPLHCEDTNKMVSMSTVVPVLVALLAVAIAVYLCAIMPVSFCLLT